MIFFWSGIALTLLQYVISLAVVISLEIQKAEGEKAMFKFNNFPIAFRYANCWVDQGFSARGFEFSSVIDFKHNIPEACLFCFYLLVHVNNCANLLSKLTILSFQFQNPMTLLLTWLLMLMVDSTNNDLQYVLFHISNWRHTILLTRYFSSHFFGNYCTEVCNFSYLIRTFVC